jgi:hypothetical protein
MQITAVSEVLAAEGLGPPVLNALIPNESNYTVLLMQPRGEIEASSTGVRNRDRDLAHLQFGQFISEARAAQADLAITPEYAMPWRTLVEAIKASAVPAEGKLWAFGCESIKYGELEQVKQELAPFATVIYETLPADGERFTDPLAYVFLAPPADGNGAGKIIVLVQFKTYPMGDPDHFEVNGLQRGTRVYQFGIVGQSIKLVSLICSDALNFQDPDANAVYDRALVVHIQLTPKPRQEQYRQYRDRLLRFHGDTTEILCLNWAKDVHVWCDGQTTPWNNISGSAWYLKLQGYDERDATLSANHRRGLYYTWLQPLRSHALFFNFEPATYLVTASKVAHIGVPAAVSRRRGPQLTRVCTWHSASGVWVEQVSAQDGFAAIVGESGNAKDEIQKVSARNPIEAERVLALSAGRIGHADDWHGVRQLDSCAIDLSEVIRRITFCQDTNEDARDFRIERLKRCGNLWDILKTEAEVPPSLADFKPGFSFEWSADFPHQNAISSGGQRATVIYMGEGYSVQRVKEIKKTAAEYLHRSVNDPKKSLWARQRLAVWYRDGGVVTLCEPHEYAQIDQTGDTSEFDIGREK